MILKGKQLALEIAGEIKKLPLPQGSFVALKGSSDSTTEIYLKKKKEMAEFLGIDFKVIDISKMSMDQARHLIEKLNEDINVHAIMIQMPLQINLDRDQLAKYISSDKDVDGFHFILGISQKHLPPTILAIWSLLERYQIELKDKKILIVGLGFLVGKPLFNFLKSKNIDVDVLEKDQENYFEKIKEADVVVVATGASLRLKESNFKDGATVIDASTISEGGKIVGDVDFDCWPESKNLAPVPGGVGPLTITMLFKNFYV